MIFDEFDESFDFRFGPFHMGVFPKPFRISYSRTSDNHIVRLKLREDMKKEEIKVRLQEGGVLEIKWPRKLKGEDIPID